MYMYMYVVCVDCYELRQACNDAHIVLSNDQDLTDFTSAYEVVLGGSANTQVFIRKGSHDTSIVTVDVTGLVSNCELRRNSLR